MPLEILNSILLPLWFDGEFISTSTHTYLILLPTSPLFPLTVFRDRKKWGLSTFPAFYFQFISGRGRQNRFRFPFYIAPLVRRYHRRCPRAESFSPFSFSLLGDPFFHLPRSGRCPPRDASDGESSIVSATTPCFSPLLARANSSFSNDGDWSLSSLLCQFLMRGRCRPDAAKLVLPLPISYC